MTAPEILNTLAVRNGLKIQTVSKILNTLVELNALVIVNA